MRLVSICLAVVACGAPQIQERKAADLAKLGPATLEASRPKEGEPRSAKVRVWVDAGVRATPQWKDNITEQLDYAGQLLVPLLGVQLKVEAWNEWNRAGDPSEALRALAEADAGKEAIWVIGYATAGGTAGKVMAELGDAQLLGRHVVVRGWADKAETDALSATLPDLRPAERAEVLAAHQRHKQTVVLLHMLARTLGAIGESDASWIQHPAYSSQQSTFSDRNRELLQLAIDGRLADDSVAQIAHVLLEQIVKQDWGGWMAGDKEQIATQLRAIVNAGKAGQSAPDVPVAALEQYERIKALAGRGDLSGALTELDNLLVAYPGNATIYLLKCELLLADSRRAPASPPGKPAPSTKAVAACARVAELAPGDPRPHVALGEFHASSGDALAAHGELQRAADKIAKLDRGAAPAWQRLLAVYQAMGALTWQEQVLARAGLDNDPAAALVASTRARYGVPRGTKVVPPDGEATLVAAIRGALDLVYASKYAEAARAIAAGEKAWPGASGFAAARCDLELRQAKLDAARAACAKALAIDPDQSWALYLAGVIALKNTTPAGTQQGIERLKRAIAVDPELGQAWRTLAKAYARAKDRPALDQLGKDYAARFGTPLPN